jgi:hypothetical protein
VTWSARYSANIISFQSTASALLKNSLLRDDLSDVFWLGTCQRTIGTFGSLWHDSGRTDRDVPTGRTFCGSSHGRNKFRPPIQLPDIAGNVHTSGIS